MAQVVVEMSGDEAKLFKSYQRIIDQAKKLDGTVKETKRSHDDAFGQQAISKLEGMVTGYLSVAGAIGAVTAALRLRREEEERAGQTNRTTGLALGKLSQLAETPAERDRIIAEAKKTLAEGGAMNMPQAVDMQHMLDSIGAGGMRASFASMQATGLIGDSTLLAKSVSRLQKSFGKAKTGDVANVVSMGMGGGKLGEGEVDQLLASTAKAAMFGARIGLSPEEVMQAVSTISGTVGPETAGDYAEQLFKNIETYGIVRTKKLKRGTGLAGYLGQMQALEKKGAYIGSIIGNRAEAIGAYGLLTTGEGPALMAQNMQNIQTAERDKWMDLKLGLAMGVPATASAAAERMSTGQKEVAMENVGAFESLAQSIRTDIMTKTYERGGLLFKKSPMMAGIAGRMESASIALQGAEDYVRDEGWRASEQTQARIAQVLEQIEQNTRENGARSRAAAGQQPE